MANPFEILGILFILLPLLFVILVMFGVPMIQSIFFVKVTLESSNYVKLGYSGYVTLGLWGGCASNYGCDDAQFIYPTSDTDSGEQFLYVLVFTHPIAAFLLLVAFCYSLYACSKPAETQVLSKVAFISGAATFFTLTAFISDTVRFKTQVYDKISILYELDSSTTAELGSAYWLMLFGFIFVFIATVYYCYKMSKTTVPHVVIPAQRPPQQPDYTSSYHTEIVQTPPPSYVQPYQPQINPSLYSGYQLPQAPPPNNNVNYSRAPPPLPPK